MVQYFLCVVCAFLQFSFFLTKITQNKRDMIFNIEGTSLHTYIQRYVKYYTLAYVKEN